MDPQIKTPDSATQEMSPSLMLDGNAVAGLLGELFGREMTLASSVCEHCGARRELGGLHAYTFAPGVVLRCPDCDAVVLRMTRTETYYWLDARGAASLRLARG
jgi:hypothetical protein